MATISTNHLFQVASPALSKLRSREPAATGWPLEASLLSRSLQIPKLLRPRAYLYNVMRIDC